MYEVVSRTETKEKAEKPAAIFQRRKATASVSNREKNLDVGRSSTLRVELPGLNMRWEEKKMEDDSMGLHH